MFTVLNSLLLAMDQVTGRRPSRTRSVFPHIGDMQMLRTNAPMKSKKKSKKKSKIDEALECTELPPELIDIIKVFAKPVPMATVHTINTGFKELEDKKERTDEEQELLNELEREDMNPRYANLAELDVKTQQRFLKGKKLQRGDLVEDTGVSPYRGTGIYVVGNGKKLHNLDDMGHVGEPFFLGPDYPVGYWTKARHDFKRETIQTHWEVHYEKVEAKHFERKKVEELKDRENLLKKAKGQNVAIQLRRWGEKPIWKVVFPWGTFLFLMEKKEDVKKSIRSEGDTLYTVFVEGTDMAVVDIDDE